MEAVRDAARDDEVRVIGVSGRGDAFSSGLDLAPADGAPVGPLSDADRVVDDLGWVGRFPIVFRLECDKPVVAGVNGVAVGAGAVTRDVRGPQGRVGRRPASTPGTPEPAPPPMVGSPGP